MQFDGFKACVRTAEAHGHRTGYTTKDGVRVEAETRVEMRLEGVATVPQIEQALRELESWAQPADWDRIVALLGELRLLTRGKNLTDDDVVAQMGVYAKRLLPYPGHLVEKVLGEWPDREGQGMWWPTWSELKASLEEPTDRAKQIRHQLLRARDAGGLNAPPAGRPRWRPPRTQIEISPEQQHANNIETARKLIAGDEAVFCAEVVGRYLVDRGYLTGNEEDGYAAGPKLPDEDGAQAPQAEGSGG